MTVTRTTVRTLGQGKMDVSLSCPWCGLISRSRIGALHRDTEDVFAVAVCQAEECSRACFLVIEKSARRIDAANQTFSAVTHPSRPATYAPIGVDERIARDVREAFDCFVAGYFYGAALVGRRVLQMAARDVVGTGYPNLASEINALPTDRVSAALKDAAHHVRLIGNEAAHADDVTSDEVAQLLNFLRQLLAALFVTPAEVAALTAMRSATGVPPA